MAKARDWAKLHRKLIRSDLWLSEEFTRGQAWVDLILMAAFKPGFLRLRGVKVAYKRGQLATAERFLCERWKWSRGKVRRFLNELENERQIVQQKNNASTVITITNYESYQGDGTANRTTSRTTDGTADGPQTVQQTDQSKERKEREEGKKEKKILPTEESPHSPPEGDIGVRQNRTDAFDRWWALVHLKTGREAARRAYGKAAQRIRAERPADDPHEFLRDRIAAFAASPNAKPTDRTPVHPATWLNQGRYDDDPATWQAGGCVPRGQPPPRSRLPTAEEDAAWNPVTGCE